MKDCFGRTFNASTIINSDSIGLIAARQLNSFDEKEVRKQLVLIHSNGDRLYFLSDLRDLFGANNFCRLNDPFTREDILEQVPIFKNALVLEQNAAHYNAYILAKNPEFLPLLKMYCTEILNTTDFSAEIEKPKAEIAANNSPVMAQLYTTIANFSEEKRREFDSLRITNRSPYNQRNLWIFPAKWELNTGDTNENRIYQYAHKNNFYHDFPHRNVLVGDLLSDPENACMHSWGLDILHLVQEYYRGMNIPYTSIFTSADNPEATLMETVTLVRVRNKIPAGSLDIEKGWLSYEATRKASSDPLLVHLENACVNYMNHLLSEMKIQPSYQYPTPLELSNPDPLLINKYNAVYQLHASLLSPSLVESERLEQFKNLYQQNDRQDVLKQHRDSKGLRFLNAVTSLLTLGIKNLITAYLTEGYFSFTQSRGARLNEQIESILEETPTSGL